MANRAVERVLPPALLWFFFWPLSAFRAFRRTGYKDRRMVRWIGLEPFLERKPVSAFARWRFRFEFDHRRIPLSFPDRLREPRWRSRFTVEGFDGLQKLARERPVVVITLHTLSCHVLPAWMRSLGIQVGAVSAGQGWQQPDVVRRAQLGQPGTARPSFTGGESRALLRHLNAGHSLILYSDYAVGHTVTVPWHGTDITLDAGGFRLAALTGAAVVPVLITSAGRWRWRVRVGMPLPDDAVHARDHARAVQYVIDELMPVVATVPQQADNALIDAVKPRRTGAVTA